MTSNNSDEIVYSAFISYASADKEKAFELCASLESRGFHCWIAPRDVQPGREYGQEIVRGIEASRCLVLLLSSAANDSPFVQREVERAVSKRKPVFPIRIEEVLPSPGLELFISTTHWLDAWSGALSDHAERVARSLADERTLEVFAKYSRQTAGRRAVRRFVSALLLVVLAGSAIAIATKYLENFGVHGPLLGHQYFEAPQVHISTASWTRGGNGVTVNYMLTDGFTEDGTINALDDIRRLAFFQVIKDSEPILLHDADPREFTGSHMASSDHSFTLSEVPPCLVSALVYHDRSSDTDKFVLKGFRMDVSKQYSSSVNVREAHKPQDDSINSLEELPTLVRRYGDAMLARIGTVEGGTVPEAPAAGSSQKPRHPVLDAEQWSWPQKNGVELSFGPLDRHRDVLRHIWLGDSPGSLSRRIDIIPKGITTQRIDGNYIARDYSLFVPIVGDAVYAQLELHDGERSEVRALALPPTGTPFIPLPSVEGSPAGETNFAYAGVREWNPLEFCVLPPTGAIYASYSVNGGPLSRCDSGLMEAFIPPPVESATLQLLFRMEDGRELGPYSYSLTGIERVYIEPLKRMMNMRRREMVLARRYPHEYPALYIDERGRLNPPREFSAQRVEELKMLQRHAESIWKRDNRSPNILANLPALVVEAREAERAPDRLWASVDRVAFSETPDALERYFSEALEGDDTVRLVQVTLEPKHLIRPNRLADRGVSRDLWQWRAALPLDLPELHCVLVYRDGDRSEPFQVPIVEVPLTN